MLKKSEGIICVLMCFIISNCASRGNTPLQIENVHNEFSNVKLMQPLSDAVRYLGLEKGAAFSLSDIDADIIIVQIFSMYCPKCQSDAENVNEFYRLINEEELSIKMVGIGFANSDFEVAIFKKKFNISFPLFPDPYGDAARELQAYSTPYFLVAKKTDDGTFEAIYTKEDKMGRPRSFLKTVLLKAKE
ncbi:peroxiredoxin family protein [Candidatus Omnitrophota bacterium]